MSDFWQSHSEEMAALTAAEQKVAAWLQSNKQQALAISIKSLASKAMVSEPTVIRFCRKLGFEGFSALKIALAQQGSESGQDKKTPELLQYGVMQLQREDTTETLVSKVLNNAMADITWLKSQSIENSVETAVGMVQRAKKIECFGLGGSAIAAKDAVFKLNRLGYNAGFTLSLHDYSRAFATWESGRMLFLFSRNSRDHIVDIIIEASKYEIPVLLVGPVNKDIEKYLRSDAVLVTTKADSEYQSSQTPSVEADLLSPIKSRLMQILIVDMVTSILGLRQNDALSATPI